MLVHGAGTTVDGDGMAERVRGLVGGPVDLALDAAPVSDALPELVRTVEAPGHALPLSGFAAADGLGVRYGLDFSAVRTDVPGAYALLAAEGRSVPVARIFALEDWHAAAELCLSGRAHGRVVLRIG